MDMREITELMAEKEARAQATILEMIGDLPDADVAPPENVLFVCKLNPVTTDDDLEIIFSRFGKVKRWVFVSGLWPKTLKFLEVFLFLDTSNYPIMDTVNMHFQMRQFCENENILFIAAKYKRDSVILTAVKLWAIWIRSFLF